MKWESAPLYTVAPIERQTVLPEQMPETVLHFSIPALEVTGAPERTTSGEIASQKLRLRGGELLVSRLNPRKSRVLLVPANLDLFSVASTEFVAVRPGVRLEAQFARYFLSSTVVTQQLDSQVRSVTRSHQRVEPETIGSVRIPLPPLDEQRRIAGFLDDQVTRIDQAIQLRKRQVELTQSLIESAAFEAVSGGLSAGRVSARDQWALPWIPDLPDGWMTPRICQVAKMGTGHTPSRSSEEYWIDCSIPWLTTGDVHRFRLDEIDELLDTVLNISQVGLANSAAVLHPPGTVALSRTASAGFSIVMGTAMATSQDYATWTCGPKLDPRFLLWCLRAMRRDLMGRLATGSTHKTIYFPDLMSIRIPLPPLSTQLQLVASIQASVDMYRRTISSVQRSIPLLEERKRSLITAAVTGEFDVSSASVGASGVAMGGSVDQ